MSTFDEEAFLRSQSEYRRTYNVHERDRYAAGLARTLAELSAEVDKAAAVLDRPGGRAIRNRLVKGMRNVVDWHRLVGIHQAELDDLTGVDRPPTQIIEFPKARITQFRVVGESDPLLAQPKRAGGRSPVRRADNNSGGDHDAA